MDCYHIPLKTTRAVEFCELFTEGEWVEVEPPQIDRLSRRVASP